MEASSFEKSIDEWLAELNDPQVERRRYALTSLMDSGTLNERIINELKLIARGDPDSKAQALAKKVLKTHGIKILPQISNQPGAKPTGFLLSGEFWVGFFFVLFSILFYF